MFIAGIKCDFCGTVHEIECRKSGDKPDVPEGWAVISPMVRIKGTPQGSKVDGWDGEKFDKDKVCKESVEKKKVYEERKAKLRAKFDKNHVCLDCIEEVLTGKRSIKIENHTI